MSKRPWMPMYWGDYLADTSHLSTLEHGAYTLLIAHYWMKGALPNNDEQLARITKLTTRQWHRLKPVLQDFFIDGWKHKRIEFELTESERISAAGRTGGKASAEARRAAKSLNTQERTAATVQRPFNDQTNDPSTIGQALQPQPQSQEEEERRQSALSAPAPQKSKRGNRLPEDWSPDFEGYQLAIEQLGSKEAAQTEFENFRDYWHARAGPGGVKLDWDATWRVWIRRSNKPGKANGSHRKNLSDLAAELADEARQRERDAGIERPPAAVGGN